jgi:hypothetical protein
MLEWLEEPDEDDDSHGLRQNELVPRTAVLADSQIFRRCFTAIFRLFVAHLGALIEGAQTCSFHGRDVHKNVFAALVGLNKSIALSCVKPLHNTRRHARSPFYANHPSLGPPEGGAQEKLAARTGGPRLDAGPEPGRALVPCRVQEGRWCPFRPRAPGVRGYEYPPGPSKKVRTAVGRSILAVGGTGRITKARAGKERS